ncbi:AIPR family protein [Paratractidigestivibacter sp.]|uniref:AIPR family protein n=1 Tax=Paratractidigestivibacter sp. TaxID=2847316 RepID=UPI002AC8A013|nr:AIPR family protein [Paratractidigestivibacter sp.]
MSTTTTMEEPLTLSFKVESFRRIPNPYKATAAEGVGDAAPEMYVAICDVKNIPGNIPMDTNPRKQKLTTTVAKKIKASLLDEASLDFYLLNRGILLSAKKASFNNYSNELTITMDDLSCHGDVDGGHTYKIILENRDQLEEGKQYVKLEILTGIEGIFESLAAARNTSTQVKDQSIAELEHRFDLIKRGIGDLPFYDRVFFEENAEGDVDVCDVLAILNMFNLDRYPGSDPLPVNSYNGRQTHVDYYLQQHHEHGDAESNPYAKMLPVMKDIFELHEQVETKMGDYYRELYPNGKFGAVKGVSVMKQGGKPYLSKFGQKEMNYFIPRAFIYPILGSLRALLEVKPDGAYGWKDGYDPSEVLDKLGSQLVDTTVERSRSLGNNPNAVGKDKGNWKTLYQTVLIDTLC